jgi:two-component system, cell cycle response regulator DivK
MPKRILLVEDNEDNREIYRTVLEVSGYEVIEATDGEAAVRIARERLPDLILMDISLPIMTGWDATEAIKAEPATRDIPIIALTAHVFQADQERAKKLGFDSFLAKPIEPRKVQAEVARLLGEPAGPPPSPEAGR